MPRSLVTGGAGFLGSHLCDSLLASGHEVVCLDNLFTGSLRNVEHLRGNARFRFVEHDVTEPFAFDVDHVWNLACPAAPGHYRYDPVKTMMTSVLGALHSLQLADRAGARLMQASTSEVYGDPEVHPQPESYRGCVNPIGPRACYDEGKRAAETLCFDFVRTRGTEVKVARIFNTYGPRMHPFDGRVVSNFIRQAVHGEPMTVFGNGKQTRSFCYVSDLVDGIIRLMEAPVNDPVNIGNPQELTIEQIARRIIEMTGSRSRIIYKPLPEDDPKVRQPDITRARTLLGWEPKVSLEEGLSKTIDYFRSKVAPSS